jgi:hypothetical protein
MARDYAAEYRNYHSKPKQKKNRASRNAARRAMEKSGRVKKGDGKDVTHRNGNPRDNSAKNLGVLSASKNRSYKRTRKAKKAQVH